MAAKQPQGPLCQRCGMPMKPVDFGTNADLSASKEYCQFCFRKGKFTDPNITMQQMIEKVARFMVTLEKMPENEAKRMEKTLIPELGRWRSK